MNGHPNQSREPLVSVVIPIYNRINLAIRAIESVLAQSYSNTEIIVINDGSDSDDSDLLNRFSPKSKFKYITLPVNVGPAAARNEGITHSSGRYIAFLDSDDVWHAEKLRIQIDRMIRHNWVWSHTSYFRHDTRTGRRKTVRSGSISYSFPRVAFSCRIATPTVVVDRNFLGSRMFRSNLRYGEDVLLWIQLARLTTLHGIDEPLATVFVGEDTAALDSLIQRDVLRLQGTDGLSGNRLLQVVHSIYRMLRNLIR